MRKRIFIVLIIALSFIFISSCVNEESNYINDLTCEVTFVGNNDKPNEVVKVEKGKKVKSIEITKVDHKFLGWYIDEGCTVPFDFNISVTASFSLYAGWKYVEPIIIKPKDITINDSNELLKIEEVNKLLENKKAYENTFDYYVINCPVTEIIDKTNGTFRIKLNDLSILVQGVDKEFNTLNLQVGDIIKLRALLTYLNGLAMINAEVKDVKYIDRFVGVNIESVVTKYNIKDITDISKLENPSKEDFTFDGWYFDEKFEHEVLVSDAFTTDVTIYAKFTPIPYFYVTVHVGDTPTTYKWLDKVSITTLQVPSKEDYTFEGWYFDEALTEEIPSDFNFTYTCDVYPKFEPIPYFYVTIHVGDAKPVRYLEPLDVTTITIPSKDKHTFVGWYFDEALTKAVPSVYSINTTCDLYPKFEPIPYYYVTFHIDGNTETFEWLDKVSITTITNPVKTDYIFNGWYFDEEYENIVPDDYLFDHTCDIYAKFTKIPYCYITVYFDGAKYENRWIERVTLSEVVSPYNTIKEGYEFRGWYFDEAYTNEIPSDYVFCEDDIIYGDLHKIMYYTVTTHVDGIINTITVKELTTILENKINDPVKDDYLFNGWYLDSDFTSAFNKETKIDSNIDLYAKFTYVETYYDVTIIIDGNSEIRSTPKNTKISQITVLDVVDYYFDGWYRDSSYSSKLNDNTKITSNITIYGRYLPIPYHVVMVHILDEIQVKNKITEDTLLKQILVNPNIVDYIFEGWYLDSSYTLLADLNQKATSDFDVYAKMTKINYYDVEINVLKDSTVKNKIKENTTLLSLLTTPSVSGYYFRGWYLDSSYSIKVNETTLVNSNLKVYAKMDKINYYTLKTIVLGKETIYSNKEEGTIISSFLNSPLVADYIFEGWYKDEAFETVFKTTTGITSDLVLYAKMTKINYYAVNVIYLNENKETVDSIDLLKIREATILSSIIKTPSFNDYYFEGFFDTDTFSGSSLDLSKISVNGDITIYGKLMTIPYFDVTIYADGVIVKTINVKDQTSISSLDTPTKVADRYGTYTFNAWYLDENFSDKALTTLKITKNINLYASFNVKRNYYIKQIIGESEIVTTLVDPNNIISKLTKPATYGDDNYQYVFKYWSLTEDGSMALKDSDSFTETDVTVYAIFDKTPYYTVKINTLGSETTQKVLKGTLIGALKTPVVSGYVFSGWFSDSTLKSKLDLNKKIESDLEIFVKMNKYITITSVVNNESTTTKLLTEDDISKIKVPDLYDYRFIGWYFDSEFKNAVPNNYVFMDSITIYAKLEAVPYYTVKVYSDTTTSYGSSKYLSQVVRENTLLTDVIRKLDTPYVKGYDFEGWYLDKTFKVKVGNETVTKDVSIYANFTPRTDTRYVVKYYLQTDTSYKLINTITFIGTTGSTVTPDASDVYETIENKDYYEPVSNSETIRGDGGTVIEVRYNRRKYTVKYYINDQVCYESDPVTWGDPVKFLSNKAFEELVGEAFISGWYKNPDFTGEIDYETMLPGGINIYGDVELIYPGSTGIEYQLNEDEDGYIVTGFTGTDPEVIISNGHNGLPVVGIASGAFYNKDITSLSLSKHITSIASFAFKDCEKLENIELSNNITSIGNMSFSGCKALVTLNLPNNLKDLGYDVFKDCVSLSNLNLSNNDYFKVIDNVLYNQDQTILIYYASGKEEEILNISTRVKEISTNAFSGNNYIKEIITNESLKFISSNSISSCNALETVSISSSVTSLGLSFIDNCTNLNKVEVASDNQYYASVDGVLYNKDQTILYLYPSNKQSSTFTIPDTVRSIEYKAFQHNKWLESIILTENIKKVANKGFYECLNLIIECNYVSVPVRWNSEWYVGVKEVKMIG